jgi:hypothetical protein
LTARDAVPAGEPVPIRRLAQQRGRLSRLPGQQQIRVKIAGQCRAAEGHHGGQRQFHGRRRSGPNDGYLTASNCAESSPSFSTLNYEANDGVPNQAIIPLNKG